MNFLLPGIVAALITFCIVPLVKKFATDFHLVDDPRTRAHPANVHTGIIPRAGGLALFLGIIVALIFFSPLTKLTIGLILALTLLTLTGLFDDKRDVNPYIRLATNGLAAVIIVAAGVGIPFVTNPLGSGVIHLDTWRIYLNVFGPHSILVWADIVAIIWIMWTMNIVGWSAGVDGQMPGFVAISAAVLGLLSLRFTLTDPSQISVTILASIVAGAFLGFLPWNWYPQKIMPGYSGKTIAGFLLAVLGILSFGKLGTALLVLGVPMIDAAYTLIRRIGTKKSPVWADRGHLHHRLLDLGWGKRRVALFYWGISAILGTIALSIDSRQKVFALLVVAVLFGGFLVWVRFFSQLSKPQDQGSG